MNIYPVWSTKRHGPSCPANKIVAKLAEWELANDEPRQFIHFSRRKGCDLCTMLRKMGWKAIAEQLEGKC